MDPLQDHPDTKRYTEHRRASAGYTEHIHELAADGKGTFTARTDGPAAIRFAPKRRVREEWAAYPDPSTVKDYNHHQPTIRHGLEIHTYLHRGDGPALIEQMDGKTFESWFRDNKEYHPTAHERMKWETRKAAQGGTPFHADTLEALAGKNPRMGGDCQTWKEVRRVDGKDEMVHHRPNAPAYVEHDRKTGSVRQKWWFLDGKQTNPDGPYLQVFDPKTGVCVSSTGDRNPDRPFDIRRDPATGKVVSEGWPDRHDRPHSVWYDPDTNRVHEDWANKRSQFLPGKPTIKTAAAWQSLKAKQGGPFTPGLDEVPRAQRPASVKDAAAAAATKAAEPKRKQQHQDQR